MQNNLLNQIKKLFKKSFQEISKDFIKNDFELMISIYLFTKKSQFHLYSIFKKVIYTYCIKRIYYRILIWIQELFLLAFIRKE